MKKISIFIVIFLTFSCSDSKRKKEPERLQIKEKGIIILKSKQTEKSIFDIVFRKIEDVEYFKDFQMNSGTVLNYGNSEWKYASSVLQNKNKRIITLEKIIETGESQSKFQILDTLHINNLTENEFISIGICEKNGKVDSRIITIIERPENAFNLKTFSEIKRAWKANFKTEKIEKISKIKGIRCMNESSGI